MPLFSPSCKLTLNLQPRRSELSFSSDLATSSFLKPSFRFCDSQAILYFHHLEPIWSRHQQEEYLIILSPQLLPCQQYNWFQFQENLTGSAGFQTDKIILRVTWMSTVQLISHIVTAQLNLTMSWEWLYNWRNPPQINPKQPKYLWHQCKLVRAEWVRCPWLLAETKVTSIV